MTPNEFERIVSADPALSAPVRSAAAAMPHSRETFGAPGELVAIAALLPVVTFVVKGVGLPWLYEAKRYTDIWRVQEALVWKLRPHSAHFSRCCNR